MILPETATLNQLRWRCRRGMRELDVLLERYLANCWAAASDARRREFLILLELADPDLSAFCLGRAAPPPELAALIGELRVLSCELSDRHAVYPSVCGRTPCPEPDL